jgi:hypothetical protein
MHLSPKTLLIPAILLVLPFSLAQELYDSDHPELMARLSHLFRSCSTGKDAALVHRRFSRWRLSD